MDCLRHTGIGHRKIAIRGPATRTPGIYCCVDLPLCGDSDSRSPHDAHWAPNLSLPSYRKFPYHGRKWRKRVGVEPTIAAERRRSPVLKTGRTTGPHALPCGWKLAALSRLSKIWVGPPAVTHLIFLAGCRPTNPAPRLLGKDFLSCSRRNFRLYRASPEFGTIPRFSSRRDSYNVVWQSQRPNPVRNSRSSSVRARHHDALIRRRSFG